VASGNAQRILQFAGKFQF